MSTQSHRLDHYQRLGEEAQQQALEKLQDIQDLDFEITQLQTEDEVIRSSKSNKPRELRWSI